MIKLFVNITNWINEKKYLAIGLYIILPIISFYIHLYHNAYPNVMSISLFGLFIIRIIVSVVVAIYLLSFLKPIEKFKQKRNRNKSKKINQKLISIWFLKISIGLLLITIPLIVSNNLARDYKIDKLTNDSKTINGKIIELEYWNGHMSSAGYTYEFYVNSLKYTGRETSQDVKIGQSISITYFKDNPWVNEKTK